MQQHEREINQDIWPSDITPSTLAKIHTLQAEGHNLGHAVAQVIYDEASIAAHTTNHPLLFHQLMMYREAAYDYLSADEVAKGGEPLSVPDHWRLLFAVYDDQVAVDPSLSDEEKQKHEQKAATTVAEYHLKRMRFGEILRNTNPIEFIDIFLRTRIVVLPDDADDLIKRTTENFNEPFLRFRERFHQLYHATEEMPTQ